MGVDESDGLEIDHLIRELAKPIAPPKPAPAARQAAGPEPVERRPVSRWTNARLLMPSAPAPMSAPEKAFALASAISLPQLPDLSRFLRLPGPVTMVRMWVGLAVSYSAAMTYWPYPKTYFWGLVLYLLSLALALVAGIWGARLSWESRLGAAHTVALGAVIWAGALAVAEILPLF